MAGLLDLLLPPRCAACGRPGWPLCGPCTASVGVIVPPVCERCGRPTDEPVAVCGDCPPPAVDAARSPFLYAGPLARAIRGMKFSGWHGLADPLAAAMVEVLGARPEVVTWVPLSRRRRARRGFDQAEALARAVARRLDLPAASLLRRIRDTRPQARRTAEDRRRALAGSFVAVDRAPPTVVLVDDVLTTGSTAAACAAPLRRAGARRVVVLTAARSVGDPVPARCFQRPA
ncbi:MAG TPA: ComF family protein [Actinomycetota bacterium]|nr:ComF family protein [Actinomycetota bacterium]